MKQKKITQKEACNVQNFNAACSVSDDDDVSPVSRSLWNYETNPRRVSVGVKKQNWWYEA